MKRPDGKFIIIAGGTSTPNAQVYDPDIETVTNLGTVPAAYGVNTNIGWGSFAFKRPDGKFLIVLGFQQSGAATVPAATTTTVIYDPVANTFTTGPALMNPAGRGATPLLLPNGRVLIVHGNFSSTSSIYDPISNTMSPGPILTTAAGITNFFLPRPDGTYVFMPGSATDVCTAAQTASNIFDPFQLTFRANTGGTITGIGLGAFTLQRADGVYLVVNGGSAALAGTGPGCTAQTVTQMYNSQTNQFVTGPAFGAIGTAIPYGNIRWDGNAVIPRPDGTWTFVIGGATSTPKIIHYQESTGAYTSNLNGNGKIGAYVVGPSNTTNGPSTGPNLQATAGSGINTYGSTGPGAVTFQRDDGKFILIGGAASSTASSTQLYKYDAGWTNYGKYRTEEINVADMDSNSVLTWKASPSYVGISAEVRTATTMGGLATATPRQVDRSGGKINPGTGETWLSVTFNFKRTFPSYDGIYTDTWSSELKVYKQRALSNPTLSEVAVTKDADLLNLQADGLSAFRVSSNGNLYTIEGATINTSGADLAERYTSHQELTAGEVVSIDPQNNHGVQRTLFQYQPDVVGVISTDPGFVTGAYTKDSFPVALIGRVPVKVSTENGIIHAGDFVTSASVPGYAMKASVAGRVIGKALESMDESKLESCPESDIIILNRKCTTITIFVNLMDFQGMPIEMAMDDWNRIHPDTVALGNDIGLSIATSTIDNGLTTGNGMSVLSATDKQLSVLSFLEKYRDYRNANGGSHPEIFTDRVSAITEVISPSMVTALLNAKEAHIDQISGLSLKVDSIETNSLKTNSLAALSGTFALEFSADGKLVIRKQGVATSSAVTASTTEVSASTTDTQVATSTDAIAFSIATSSDDSIAISFDQHGNAFFAGKIVADSVETGGLSVSGAATFAGGLSIGTAGATTTMLAIMSDAMFIGRPYFTSDTGGTAVIKKGSRVVDVIFTREYLDTPIVTSSLAYVGSATSTDEDLASNVFDNNIQFIITKKNVHGFTIRINKKAPADIAFSWIALAIKDAKEFSSKNGIDDSVANTTPAQLESATTSVNMDISTTTPSSLDATTTLDSTNATVTPVTINPVDSATAAPVQSDATGVLPTIQTDTKTTP
jgi:hypothetical protein